MISSSFWIMWSYPSKCKTPWIKVKTICVIKSFSCSIAFCLIISTHKNISPNKGVFILSLTSQKAKVITSVGLSILRYFKFNSCIWSISKKFTSKNNSFLILSSLHISFAAKVNNLETFLEKINYWWLEGVLSLCSIFWSYF